MKLDLDPPAPATPNQQLLDAEPTSEPRSSRVTINVRTPSQSLDGALSLPPPLPSPPPNGTTPPATSLADAVELAVEEPEAAMAHMDTVIDTPLASTPDSESPPIISLDSDDDADFDGDESVTMLDGPGVSLLQDPSVEVPYHEPPDTYFETFSKLANYLPTRRFLISPLHQPLRSANLHALDEQVSRSCADWIEKYIIYARAISTRAAAESCYVHREIWQTVPELVMSMVNRK